MTASESIRFLHHQAQLCRDRDKHEALCLLLPAMLRVLELEPMDDYEARDFRAEFKQALEALTVSR